MKKLEIFNFMEDFESFVNRTDIEIIDVQIQVVPQLSQFQQGFAGLVYYKDLNGDMEKLKQFLYSEITERRPYSASRMCEEVLKFIEENNL